MMMDKAKHILFCLVGMTPQIIIEMLYASRRNDVSAWAKFASSQRWLCVIRHGQAQLLPVAVG